MKVSLDWLKLIGTKIDLPIDELVDKIGRQLGEVEEVADLSEVYKDPTIVKVVTCDKHDNADKLSVCMVDDGGKTKSAERDANGTIRVVCGAPNVAAGMLAVWLPAGTVIPATYGKDNIIIESKEIRGVVSNGMLASAKELGISDDHSGILEINPNDAKPGDSFAEAYRLNDHVIDIENKMFTHRPDCFGQVGVAREVAGITGQAFTSPDWYLNYDPSGLKPDNNDLPFKVVNEIPELVPRFMAIALEVEGHTKSPMWLQTYLYRVGVRPISLIVDVTNFMMMSTAQPLHAYDYDKVKALSSGSDVTITVRLPKDGEKIKLLTGREITPKSDDIMIATDSKLIGVGGVMGGSETEVDENTKRIILECANFNMYSIRRTSMANGLFTEAVTRFNKGQSPLQNDRVVTETVKLLKQISDTKIASPLIDIFKSEDFKPVKVGPIGGDYINDRLGSKLDEATIAKLLTNVEFKVSPVSGGLEIEVPFWRTDIAIKEDIVEEVGRLNGYDNLPLTLPKRDIAPAKREGMFDLKKRIRQLLSSAGANEVLSYSFVHSQLLDKVGQSQASSYQLSNALSPNLQFYRVSLLPSLLDKVHPNIKTGYDEFALFEMNKVHIKGLMDASEPELPAEETRLALVIAVDDKLATQKYSGAAYYEAVYYLNFLFTDLGISFSVKPLDKFDHPYSGKQALAPFEPVRSGLVVSGDDSLGIIGEPKVSVKRELKLPNYVAMVELDMKKLLALAKPRPYTKLSSYPRAEQDVCFKLPVDVAYQTLRDLVLKSLMDIAKNDHITLAPVDIYRKSADSPDKQITFRLTLNSYEKTLTTAEFNETIAKIGEIAKQQLKAEII